MAMILNENKKDVLVFFGSPNRHGNTGELLNYVVCKNKSVRFSIVSAYDRNVKPCIDCCFCQKRGYCRFRDLDDVVKKIYETPLIIIATPIYNGSFPSPLKAIFDRFQVFFHNKNHNSNKKKAFLLATCGKKAHSTCAQILITQTAYILKSINATFNHVLIFDNTDKKNLICQDKVVLNKTIRSFLKNECN